MKLVSERAGDFSLFQTVPAGCYLAGTGVLSLARRLRRAADYLYLAPRLRMSGAVPLLPLYAFMSWTWAILPLSE
jgi:hypothetical protein